MKKSLINRVGGVLLTALFAGSLNAQDGSLETFDSPPSVSASQTAGSWYVDRYAPATFQQNTSVVAPNNVLEHAIDGVADGSANRGGQSGTFYNTQGRKYDFTKTIVSVTAELYVDGSFINSNRRAGLWGTAVNNSNTITSYPIISCRNVDGSSPTFSYYNSVIGDWVDVSATINYFQFNTFTIELDVANDRFWYFINGVQVGSNPAGGSTKMSNMILQAYNFNDPALDVAQQSSDSYTVYWDNVGGLETNSNIPTPLVTNITQTTTHGSDIQAAIDAANAGDVIELAEGSYPLNATLDVNQEVTLQGANGGADVFITPGSLTTQRMIETDANNVTLQDLNIVPINDPDPNSNNNIGFTIKAGSNSVPTVNTNLTIDNVNIVTTAYSPERSAFDIHGVDGVTLTDVSVSNTTRGNGINITGCTNVDINGFTGSNNAWGSIAIYASVPFSRGSDNVTIDGSLLDIDGAIYNQNDLVGFGRAAGSDYVNTNVSVTGWDYEVYNADFRSGGDGPEYTFYTEDSASAVTTALDLNSQNGGNTASVVYNNSNDEYEVSAGLAIQSAIDEATTGDVVNVGAGTFVENVMLDEEVTLQGPNNAVAGNGSRSAEAIIEGPVRVEANNVTISGLSIDGTNVDQTPALSKRGILVANTASQDNVTIENNIIQNWATGVSLAGGIISGWVDGANIEGNLFINNGIGSTENVNALAINNNAFDNAGVGFGAGAVLAVPMTGNDFVNGTSRYISAAAGVTGVNFTTLLSSNTFDKAAYLDDATGSWYEQAIFAAIQPAIDAANNGANITVSAANYDETLLINKPLSLLGPNASTSAVNGSRAAEAVLGEAINISANQDVTVSGFEFLDVVTTTTWTIYIQGNSDNFTFENNRFINSQRDAIRSGISSTTSNITVTGNLIEGMNDPVASAILLGGISGTSVISDNEIDLAVSGTPTGYAGIQVPSADGLTISGNSISNTTNQGIQLAGTCGDVTISGNTVSNTNTSNGGDKGAIRLYGTAFTGTVIIANNILTGSFNGISVRDGEDITGKDIQITGNDLTGNSNAGVYNGATAGSLNADCNWWGGATLGDVSVSGSVVVDQVLNSGANLSSSANGFQSNGTCNCLQAVDPVLLAETGIGNNDATINWETVPGLTYQVWSSFGGIVNVGTAATYTFSGLDEGKTYTYVVRSFCKATASANISGSFTTTGTSCTAPVTGDQGTPNLAGTSATLTWDARASAASYQVWTPAGGVVNVATNSYSFSTNPGTVASYGIRTRCGTASSPWKTGSFSTGGGFPCSGGPFGVSSTNVTNTSADITWQDIAGESRYLVWVQGQGVSSVAANSTSFSVSGLNPGTNYSYAVLSVCGGTSSPWVSGSFNTTGSGKNSGGDLSPDYGVMLPPASATAQANAMLLDAAITVFPNPTNGQVNIASDNGSALKSVQIMDMNGRVIYQQGDIAEATLTLDLSAYAKGVYMVRVIGQQASTTKNVILK